MEVGAIKLSSFLQCAALTSLTLNCSLTVRSLLPLLSRVVASTVYIIENLAVAGCPWSGRSTSVNRLEISSSVTVLYNNMGRAAGMLEGLDIIFPVLEFSPYCTVWGGARGGERGAVQWNGRVSF
jgi:hypothetical protein